MSQMSQFEPLDVKFKALLDPIKDLAANWDIDIADSLTDYLEELDGLRMSVDGQSNLNFAAAGLLIQGSTAVYSKKVEFLHQLVQQSLDEITNSRNSSSVGQGKTKGNANSTCLDDERLLFGTDPSFLLLDDAVEEGSNINLDEQTDSLGNAKERRRSSVRIYEQEKEGHDRIERTSECYSILCTSSRNVLQCSSISHIIELHLLLVDRVGIPFLGISQGHRWFSCILFCKKIMVDQV